MEWKYERCLDLDHTCNLLSHRRCYIHIKRKIAPGGRMTYLFAVAPNYRNTYEEEEEAIIINANSPHPRENKLLSFLFLVRERGRRRLIGWGNDKGRRLDTICAPIWERRGWCHCRHQEKGKILPQKESSETIECDNVANLRFQWGGN